MRLAELAEIGAGPPAGGESPTADEIAELVREGLLVEVDPDDPVQDEEEQ